MGNLDTIDEYPVKIHILDLGLCDEEDKPKSFFSRKMAKMKRKAISCIFRNSKSSKIVSGKKTPILAQKEMVIKGATIWEEEINDSVFFWNEIVQIKIM